MITSGFNSTIHQMARITAAEVAGCADTDRVINNVLIDSRNLVDAEKAVFVAIKGQNIDGHLFIERLVDAGVKAFIVADLPEDLSCYPYCCFLRVDDTIDALQALAAWHRNRFSPVMIGITGSNGKTIVKEWLFRLLNKRYAICRSPLSYNSQVGVPLSVFQLNARHDMAIMEAGISQPHEMIRLENIIQPTIGIFTGIGEAHGENFRDKREKTAEKLQLFTRVETLIAPGDDEKCLLQLKQFCEEHQINLIHWGSHSDSTIRVGHVITKQSKTTINLLFEEREYVITIPFTDEASVKNAVSCAGYIIAIENNYDLSDFECLEPVDMRLEQLSGIHDIFLINDSYNNDIEALRITLDLLKNNTTRPRRTLILSDILQSGLPPEKLYRQVAQLVNRYPVDRFIGIGKNIVHVKPLLSTEAHFFQTTDDFINYFPFSRLRNEIVLLKGARYFKFEKIRDALQKRTHQTRMEINLSALVANLNFYRSKLQKGTKVMAMVKAFSYGSGSFEIAQVLQYHKVDYLAVAYADEGVELRKAGIDIPVMVMNPDDASFGMMIRNRLEPEIYSFESLKNFLSALRRVGYNPAEPWPVHIKVDTGMHRLGFYKEDMQALIQHIEQHPEIQVRSVFSHLAASDNPAEQAFTAMQISQFLGIRMQVTEALNHKPLFHMVNSAGIINYPDAHFDMVRLGIGLYGIGHDAVSSKSLSPVSTLKSVVSQVKSVMTGESVGYNRSFIATKPTTIAIVAIGYADGYSRSLGNGSSAVTVKGYCAPVIGDVCMDMIMVDVSEIKEVKAGDEVIIFHDYHSIITLAEAMNTIPYEVITGISSRVKRVYLSE
ncbi:MAG: bifunctional UDP-N-acetylmuramoyl-tripeptide:D-alanyl-D-alanine ligase/alanine racemase [Bacteroidales bacterium]|nr:bifunctional UDP-N-acetylmuramoyl-tripeptide:D-alanyl-D-alanine ligase/alanine racemase [Bacteroidales bacterium]